MVERLGHDRGLVRELLETFLAASPQMLAQVHEALAAGDAMRLERGAHGLRGALVSVSAGAAAAAAEALEHRARERDLDACRVAAAVLETEVERLELALGTYLRGPT